MYYNTTTRLLMQFHITGRCNLRCKHCYRTEGDVETLPFESIIDIIEQYKVLLAEYNKIHRIKKRGHINITGGEPFYRSDITGILEYLGENRELFSYGVLSNGSFIDKHIIEILKSTEVSFVQLSIDGNREMHDSLRAKGDYDRVLDTARMLEENDIRTYISFTATKSNHKHLPSVAAECRKRRITKLWSDRLVPIGNGKELEELQITPEELPRYLRSMKKAQGGWITRLLFPKTQVSSNRALQFLGTDGCLYSCSAAKSLVTVDEFGNVMPCRRMPIICGNVQSTPLRDIYFKSEVFRELREDRLPKECSECAYSFECRGGAKCQSYAVTGSFYRADPACPYKKPL